MEKNLALLRRSPYPKLTVVHWSEFKGFKFYVKPCPEMVTKNYYAEIKRVGNKKNAEQDHVTVVYDRDYISAYFSYHFQDILRQKSEIYQNQLNILLNSFIKCKELL